MTFKAIKRIYLKSIPSFNLIKCTFRVFRSVSYTHLATTGIAGPDGGTQEKQVGLVYIGIRVKDKVYVERKIFNGSRNKVRERAVLQSLFSLIKILKKGESNE